MLFLMFCGHLDKSRKSRVELKTWLIGWLWLDSQLNSVICVSVEKSCENIIIVIPSHLVVISLHEAISHDVVIPVEIVIKIEFSANNYTVS